MEQAPPFGKLIASAHRDAVHLEMGDFYTLRDPVLLGWKAGRQFDPAEMMADWYQTVRRVVARGLVVRRARIASDPLSDLTRHGHWMTARLNIAARNWCAGCRASMRRIWRYPAKTSGSSTIARSGSGTWRVTGK